MEFHQCSCKLFSKREHFSEEYVEYCDHEITITIPKISGIMYENLAFGLRMVPDSDNSADSLTIFCNDLPPTSTSHLTKLR